MEKQDALQLLEAVRDGRVDPQQALLQLKLEPFEDLGFAKVDHHRGLRQGAQEVIYGAGKTPEQIAQERKDNVLRQKIDAYNQGAKVTFTKEEQARILEMQNAQNKARKLMADKEMNEGYINDAEKSLNAYDRRREIEERNARANELKNRSAALKAAEDQLRIAKEANQPMEAVLKKIEEILKNGLPHQTV